MCHLFHHNSLNKHRHSKKLPSFYTHPVDAQCQKAQIMGKQCAAETDTEGTGMGKTGTDSLALPML